MSSFTTPAQLELLDGGLRFRLLAPFVYHVGQYPSAQRIEVPAGFETDLASIPRILWSWLPPHGRYAKAALLHDWLYSVQSTPSPCALPPTHPDSSGEHDRAFADRVFLEAMAVLGVSAPVRYLLYAAVRLAGAAAFRRVH